MNHSDVFANIEKQLIEIEILKSIYSNLNEFQVEDEDALIEAQLFVNKQEKTFKRNLGFIINLNVDLPDDIDQKFAQLEKLPLEIVSRLPTSYPLNAPPNVFIRCSKQNLNRKFTEELSTYVNTSHENDCSILNIIEWIKDNIHRFLDCTNKNSKSEANKDTKSEKFSRVWIYSHHIYSLNKRKTIIQWAKDLDLNGFSKPGKPGVICVEGAQSNVQEYLTRIKSINWQRLTVKEVETFEANQEWKKFVNFEEKTFTTDSNSTNIDLGLFFTYLKEKNLESIFHLYFGVDGKESIKT